MRERLRFVTGVLLAAAAVVGCCAAGAVGSALTGVSADWARAARCAQPSAVRDPANPLMLPGDPRRPAANPLSGALPYLFIDGPRHGAAAAEIVRLLGRSPGRYSDGYSWARFAATLQAGSLHRKLARDPSLARKVALLSKIAAEPEENRFSLYSGGGGPGAVFGQVRKFFCHTLRADPGSIPVITTYFLYQYGYCESTSQIIAGRPRFERQVRELAAGIGHRRAVLLLELDAVGASRCMLATGALPYWESDIRYEIEAVAALPHTVVYVEGGYADSNRPGYTARVLNAVGVRRIRGFFTNDTHEDWTSNEISWAQQVSRLTGGSHFIVNTATNGQGPLVPRNRVRSGNEVLCNPPGRGIGPRPTTSTGFRGADAFLWTGVPGNSSGPCSGSPLAPSAGTFWPARALAMAARANGRLGPGYPSRPY